MIRDKWEQIVPLIPNEVQRSFLDVVVPRWREGDYTCQGRRENVLKFRQPGFSTIIDALLYIWTTENRNFKAWIVGADDDGAKLLFEIVQRFYDHDKRKLVTRYAREDRLTFRDIGSEIRVWSANKVTLGRGTTLSALHMSELAWWNSMAVRGGLLQAVPKHGNVFEETTGHGFNPYEKKYQSDKRGETNFRAWFFPWNIFAEYEAEPMPDFKRTEEEERLAHAFDLSNRKLQWRRDKKRELDSTETPFPQEYPLTDQEAFVSSGNPYFNRERLIEIRDELQGVGSMERIVFSPDSAMKLRKVYAAKALKVWALPQEDHYYILSADPSMGLTDRGDTDYCSADVLDADTWEQVAHLHGKWEPYEFAEALAELGYWYNTALLVVLNQGRPGGATTENLLNVVCYPKQRGRGLAGLFYFNPSEITGKAVQNASSRLEAGFPENELTKKWMLDKLSRAITIDPGLTINNIDTIDQMLSYVHTPGGGAGGEKGSHDDRVSSIAVGAALLNLRFERRQQQNVIKPVEPIRRFKEGRGDRY